MTDQPELFFVKQVPRTRVKHHAEVRAWKEKYGIWTHLAHGAGEWMALSMPECVNRLKGYSLTEEEKACGAALLAGYSRLLDEANLVEDNHRTEYEACKALVERIEKPEPNP